MCVVCDGGGGVDGAAAVQRLSGDITIVPPFKVSMYTNIISNPTWDTIKQFMQYALRCTWPNISVIRSHCQVELMLDRSARSLAKLYQGAVTCVPSHACALAYTIAY